MIRPVEETMSLTTLLVFGILGIDFAIYHWFQRIFGDKRAILAQNVRVLRAQLPGVRGHAETRVPGTFSSSSAVHSTGPQCETTPMFELPIRA